jgi:hypothetical protein
MNVYVDSSVTLRVVLRQADALASWDSIDRAFSSELTRVECLRTVDRARIRFALTDDTVAAQRAALLAILAGMEVVSLDRVVLERAAEPLPTLLGTLDAIHLATATLVRNAIPDLAFATHDSELGLAARAVGFSVDGVPA